MSNLQSFVEKRLADGDLPWQVARTYRSVIGLSVEIRDGGKDDDWLSWLTGADAGMKLGEYVFGGDPASEADRVSDRLLAALAATWSHHPDYKPKWNKIK